MALAWVIAQPGVTAPIIGASQVQQLHDNVASLSIQFSTDQLNTLNQASAPELFFTLGLKKMIFGGTSVQGWA